MNREVFPIVKKDHSPLTVTERRHGPLKIYVHVGFGVTRIDYYGRVPLFTPLPAHPCPHVLARFVHYRLHEVRRQIRNRCKVSTANENTNHRIGHKVLCVCGAHECGCQSHKAISFVFIHRLPIEAELLGGIVIGDSTGHVRYRYLPHNIKMPQPVRMCDTTSRVS